MNLFKKNYSGITTLLTILMISAVGLVIVLAMTLLSLDAGRTSLGLENSARARALVNLCAENSLLAIKDSNFIGANTINVGTDNCDYMVVDDGGENRTINISANVKNYIRKSKIIIDQINPNINTVSWQEVSGF